MSHALGEALERDTERKKGDPESPLGRVLATHRPRSTRSGAGVCSQPVWEGITGVTGQRRIFVTETGVRGVEAANTTTC